MPRNHSTGALHTDAHIHPWRALAPLLGGLAVGIMDVSLVMVALPSMQTELGITATRAGWIPTAFMLTFATALLSFGRLGDAFGQRLMFLWGAAGFAVFSALCTLAPSYGLLVTGRALQGLAGALMVPQIMATIAIIIPSGERARAFALFAAVGSLAAVAGPLLGGLVLTADPTGLGWRSIFLLNAVLALLVVIAGIRLIPAVAASGRPRIDGAGAVFFGIAVLLVVYPLIEARTHGWQLWLLALMACSVPTLTGFYLWQRLSARRGTAQLLPTALLGNRRFLLLLGLVALFFSGIPGLIMVLSIMLQSGHGLSPLATGLMTAASPLGVLAGSAAGSRLTVHDPLRRIGVGALALALGMAALHVLLATAGGTATIWAIAGPLLACGVGMGTSVPTLFQTVMDGIGKADSGAASGAAQTLQYVGGAVGIAFATQVFFGALPNGTRSSAAEFSAATATATWYQIALYSLLAAALLLRRPASTPASERNWENSDHVRAK